MHQLVRETRALEPKGGEGNVCHGETVALRAAVYFSSDGGLKTLNDGDVGSEGGNLYLKNKSLGENSCKVRPHTIKSL